MGRGCLGGVSGGGKKTDGKEGKESSGFRRGVPGQVRGGRVQLQRVEIAEVPGEKKSRKGENRPPSSRGIFLAGRVRHLPERAWSEVSPSGGLGGVCHSP